MDLVSPATRPATGWAERLFGTREALRSWALWNLVANVVIIITGAVVRLTDSGLGCDTWPRCSDQSFTPHGAVNHHNLIEFGNRTLTFVLIAVSIGTVLAARRAGTRAERRWAWLVVAGVPLQGVVGGISVLLKLNPWWVALHLLLSAVWLVWLCTLLVMSTREVEHERIPVGVRRLVQLLFGVMLLVIWLGTVVTGAGPNSGDRGAARNHLDIEMVARIHALAVWVAVGLTAIVLLQALRRRLPRTARWAGVLLGAELLQGAIGYAQYFLGLPTALVICHLTGVGLLMVAVTWLSYGTRPVAAG